MENYLINIKKRIEEKINIEKINIIDNTDLHKSHKFFDIKKKHLKIEITSIDLSKMKRLDAQKRILDIFKEDFKDKLHALEIVIK